MAKRQARLPLQKESGQVRQTLPVGANFLFMFSELDSPARRLFEYFNEKQKLIGTPQLQS